MKNLSLSLRPLLAALAVGLTSSLSAEVLMLDFGGNTGSSLITATTSSPYHTASGAGLADTTWNSVALTNQSAGSLKWADGTTATTVSYLAWKFSAGSTTASGANTGWQTSVNGSAITSVNDGIYAAGTVGYDGSLTSSGFATDNRAIGVQISGLGVGTYDVYVSGRYNPATTPYTLNFYAGTNSGTTGFNFSGYQSESVSFTADNESKTSAWAFTSGDSIASNYVKFTISITAENQSLNIASQGANGYNGVLSSIQIVSAIPEPSSYALLAGAGGLLVVGARRRVRTL